MKSIPALTLLLCLLMMACSGPKQEQPNEIINIDVLKAFNTQKNVKLSEFIRDVEFIPLESTKDAWFRGSENYLVGEKYVMILAHERAQVLLFDRNGKFIRAIGFKGRGPHELIEPRVATMDPAEEFVFIHDVGQSKLVKFSVDGTFINEANISKTTPARYITGMQFINENEFVVANFRPWSPMEGFASLPVFDKNLNHVRDILPRANDENLLFKVAPNDVLTVQPERTTFWEPYLDTLYTITPAGAAIPTHVIGFSKGGPDHEFVTTNINPNLYSKYSIVSIMDDGHYFHILGMKDNDWFRALYNQKTKEIFEVVQKSTCDTTKYASRYGFENDLFGAGRMWLTYYSKKIDRFYMVFDIETFADRNDLACIRENVVKFPALRDRFLEWAKDPEAKYQKLIVLMRAK